MVEPTEAATTATAVVTYLAPAVASLGASAFDEPAGHSDDPAVDYGIRLLQVLLPARAEPRPNGDEPGAVEAVREDDVRAGIAALGERHDDPTVAAVLEADIAKLLTTDGDRLRAVRQLLAAAPQAKASEPERQVGG
jgi:hypothetical protein